MTTCDKCGHGALPWQLTQFCANPRCSATLPGHSAEQYSAKGIEVFQRFMTPTGLWLWVLDTGKGEA